MELNVRPWAPAFAGANGVGDGPWTLTKKVPAAFPRRAGRSGSERGDTCNDRPAGAGSAARQQHGVDHVDDAVRLEHVLDRHLGGAALGVPDRQRVALAPDRDVLAFDGLVGGAAAVLL